MCEYTRFLRGDTTLTFPKLQYGKLRLKKRRLSMTYRIMVDGQEHIIKKRIPKHSREADNKAREEIIKHYLDTEDASEVLIIEESEEAICLKRK